MARAEVRRVATPLFVGFTVSPDGKSLLDPQIQRG
jgi:hypothetical protein